MKDKDRRPQVVVTMLVPLLLLLAVMVPSLASSTSTSALITAVYYDTYLTDEPDKAFRLMNISESAVDFTDWTLTDLEGTITLSDTLAAGVSIWIAREADDFSLEFGFPPDYEYGAETDPTMPNLTASGTFALANTGDQVILKDDGAVIVDSVVYEAGEPTDTGWSGPGIYPYGGDTVGLERFAQGVQGVEAFGKEGQVLYRKLDQATGLPVPDTDTAADWAQATDDPVNGKKVQYPGWDLERYFRTETFTETATLTYAVAPDNIYETVLAEINQATTSIYYEGYTFKNAHLADAIVARMTAVPTMTVTILLEGEPVGGITDQEKWICQQIENAGGQVYFMYTDDATDFWDDRLLVPAFGGRTVSDTPNLWEVRELPDGLTLELRAGDDPVLVLAQRDNRVRVELPHIKTLVAALTDAAADLAEVLASDGVYHA